MHLARAISELNDAHTIYFLLTAYLEAACYAGAGWCMPPAVRRLPVRDAQDVAARLRAIAAARATRELLVARGEHALLTEAFVLFECAAVRLRALGPGGTRERKAALA